MHELLYCDDHSFMNMQHFFKRLIAKPYHTAYVATCLYMMYEVNWDYVTKASYNKDKDLLFVYKPYGFGGEREYVHEVHHLERRVPTAVTAWKDLSYQADDGIITVTDLAKKE